MKQKQKYASDVVVGKMVLVAVKASKEISRTALVWALTHVVQPGDCIKLLVVIPSHSSSKKIWGFSRFTTDCATSHWMSLSGTSLDQRDDVAESCSQMMCQLHHVYDPEKIKIRIKVVSDSPFGVVAAEAKRAQSNWVILDKRLKHEKKYCMEELQCNVVVMKRSLPKVLRLNLNESQKMEPEVSFQLPFSSEPSSEYFEAKHDKLEILKGPFVTPVSSPEQESPLTTTDAGTSSISSSDPGTSPFLLSRNYRKEPDVFVQLPFGFEPSSQYFEVKQKLEILKGPFVTPVSSPEQESPLTTTDARTSSISSSDPGTSPFLLSRNYRNGKKDHSFIFEENRSLYESESDAGGGDMVPPSSALYFQPWTDDVFSSRGELSKHSVEGLQRLGHTALTSTYKLLLHNLSTLDQDPHVGVLNYKLDLNLSRSVREAVSLSRNVRNSPPPLCTVCQHKAPAFGHPPRWFTFAELKLATDGFSASNFLAEGGFGSVHRGVFQDGKVVAVKQHKLASSQGDVEFCSEVEVLSCAQHRNVVMLIGFCVEEGKRLLVYEYVCNGSLDSHLYGQGKAPLDWPARKKIALGAARGLRYLHEECRVGCIVHRDMRPNNILLTHDFEPLVGDFGLARWQPNGDMGEETRVIGTFGYLAPEYAQSGQITEKADVYSFGVVLLELVTGRKAIDINRPKGQQCLTEWARRLLEKEDIDVLVDPRLRSCYSEQEVYSMLQCATFCIRRDPHSRPRMSQVLRILEG